MINFIPGAKRNKYPHLAPADVSIWERFIDAHSDLLDQVAYDVRVGKGRDPGLDYDENIRRMSIMLSQLRIDVLSLVNGVYDIIEVKRFPGVSAIGQLVCYGTMFRIDYPDLYPVTLTLICDRVNDDLVTLLTAHNIRFFVV